MQQSDEIRQDVGTSRKRTKLLWTIGVGVAVTVGLWFWIGWYSLAVLAVIVWINWDPMGFGTRAEGSGRASPHDAYKWPSP